MPRQRKLIITGFIVVIVLVTLISVAPTVISAFMGPGLKTEALSDANAKPATTDINGTWQVQPGAPGTNNTSAGFTFDEVLPSDHRRTSGSTPEVSGTVIVANGQLTEAEITVDMTNIQTDNERRDINVRDDILDTEEFPNARFVTTKNVNLSTIPGDGTAGTVTVAGQLTIHGVTKEVSADMEVLRDGDQVILSTTIPINRLDYGVQTPDFVAAQIAEEGEINVLLRLKKEG